MSRHRDRVTDTRKVAYFSMEIGIEEGMPTYSGGLGILAGDTIRSAADLSVPMVAVTLLHRKGYFHQHIDASGWQTEQPADWNVAACLEEMPHRATVTIEGRLVELRAWRYEIAGLSGFKVPIYFLDTDLAENTGWDRTLTHFLYGGDAHYRLCQEVVLGIGGVKMLQALGYMSIERFHMNEGHAALLTVRLLADQAERSGRNTINREDIEAVRKKCVFTTHTPVPAGHDQFPMDMVSSVMRHRQDFLDLKDIFSVDMLGHIIGRREAFLDMKDVFRGEDRLNMTYLALYLSHYINGVAKRHGEVSQHMFGEYAIDSITNGVHAPTWVSHSFAILFDRYISGWKQDSFSLRYALSIPDEEVWLAHIEAKRMLLSRVNRETNTGMEENVLTIGFARRAATYKRADLVFHDLERLRKLGANKTALQLIYAGKAHPQDQGAKEMIKHVFQAIEALHDDVRIVWLENYDMDLGKQLTAGVDLWLNTPQPPLEASGTSGMKAALNGVPSLSVLDGWWIEGCIEGVTGWAIGTDGDLSSAHERSTDATSLYDKLEGIILPMFYRERSRFIEVMRHAVALNGSFFNTQRMVQQYVLKAYFE
jgi:glycogen phosphorylase